MDDRSILGSRQLIAQFALHRFEGSTSRSAVGSCRPSAALRFSWKLLHDV